MFQGQHKNNKPVSPSSDADNKDKEETVVDDSFGGRFRKSWQRLSEASSRGASNNSVAEQAAAKNADKDNGISDLLHEVDQNGGSSILLRRADQISLSYYSPTSQRDDANKILSEFELISTDTQPAVINGINAREGLLSHHIINSCCSLEGSQQSSTFMKVGDVVEYACGVDCRRGKLLDHKADAGDLNGRSNASDGEDTNGATTATESISVYDKISAIRSAMRSLDTTVCVITTQNFNDPIRLCQSTVLFSKKEIMDEIEAIQLNNLKAGGSEAMTYLDIGISFSRHDDRLTIGAISKSEGSWFRSSGCAIREGDIVVGINEFIASRLSPQDAASFIINDVLSSPKTCHLTISTIAASQLTWSTKWGKIRKAAVAAGGGTLVASGAILMATPLHPVGHAMALGGVGILGTEYDAPRKVWNSAKERLSERQSWNERRALRKASAGSNSSASAQKHEESNRECTEHNDE